jgi:hypothetical protein
MEGEVERSDVGMYEQKSAHYASQRKADADFGRDGESESAA